VAQPPAVVGGRAGGRVRSGAGHRPGPQPVRASRARTGARARRGAPVARGDHPHRRG
jgi:hypothetical protein